MQSEQIDQLATALAKAQGEMENATMNKTNPHFRSRYADLGSVLDAIRKPLSAAGLAIVQTIETSGEGMVLRTTLMHASGQWMASEYPLPLTSKPQELGSLLTYLRRYELTALICNASDEDDDAEAATKVSNDAYAKYIADCKAKIAERTYDQAVLWMNATEQKQARKDFGITEHDLEMLTALVKAKAP